jgi:hypothetical protein
VGTRAVAEVDQLIHDRLDPHPLGQCDGHSSPALATAWASSKPTTTASRLWEDAIEEVSS